MWEHVNIINAKIDSLIRVVGLHCDSCALKYNIQDTDQFIGNHVGWIGIHIIKNTIQES